MESIHASRFTVIVKLHAVASPAVDSPYIGFFTFDSFCYNLDALFLSYKARFPFVSICSGLTNEQQLEQIEFELNPLKGKDVNWLLGEVIQVLPTFLISLSLRVRVLVMSFLLCFRGSGDDNLASRALAYSYEAYVRC